MLARETVEEGLRAKTARGGAVTLAAHALKSGIRIASMMILARLLTPEDFGIQGMVIVVTGFVSLIKDGGLGLATVQRETITHDQTSTLFWINGALGLILAAVLIGVAPILATFYGEPRLNGVAMVSSVAFILNGLWYSIRRCSRGISALRHLPSLRSRRC